METSAKTGECVDEAFMKCAKSILDKIDNGKYIVVTKKFRCILTVFSITIINLR